MEFISSSTLFTSSTPSMSTCHLSLQGLKGIMEVNLDKLCCNHSCNNNDTICRLSLCSFRTHSYEESVSGKQRMSEMKHPTAKKDHRQLQSVTVTNGLFHLLLASHIQMATHFCHPRTQPDIVKRK